MTSSLSARERAGLADTLLEVGPDAPTLCEGWTAADLLTHVITREQYPVALIGPRIPIAAVESAADRTLARIANTPWPERVDLFRHPTVKASPASIPALDRAMNTTEYFIHHEDVLRAQDPSARRTLSAEDESTLWGNLKLMSKMLMRTVPVGVILVTPDNGGFLVRRPAVAGTVTLTGKPSELLLYCSGRRDAADVVVDGVKDAVLELEATPTGI